MKVTRITFADRSKAARQNAYHENQHNLSWGECGDDKFQ